MAHLDAGLLGALFPEDIQHHRVVRVAARLQNPGALHDPVHHVVVVAREEHGEVEAPAGDLVLLLVEVAQR